MQILQRGDLESRMKNLSCWRFAKRIFLAMGKKEKQSCEKRAQERVAKCFKDVKRMTSKKIQNVCYC